MTAPWDLLGLGAVAVDDLLYVDHYPALDGKAQVREERREGGGLAGTALVAASRMGARVAYCGVLGEDELSRYTLAELEREGVDCSPVLRQAGARPIHSRIIVQVPPEVPGPADGAHAAGRRSIFFSTAGVVTYPADRVRPEMIARCQVLFVDNTAGNGGLRAAALARQQGLPVVGDIEREPDALVAELMTHIDHLILGIDLAGRITGEGEPAAMIRGLLSEGRACCVVTAGERGCWYAERGGQVRHQPALKVQAVDTTGCGDVFHGAYAAWLAQGAPIPRAIQAATIAAGLKATRPGGRSGIPTRELVQTYLRERDHA